MKSIIQAFTKYFNFPITSSALEKKFQINISNTLLYVMYIHQKQACNFIKKETLAQVFSCDFCEISKNTFSYRTPLVVASVLICARVSF